MKETKKDILETLQREQRWQRRAWIATICVIAIVWAAPARGTVTIPYIFTAGTPARADQINANFAVLASAVDAVEATTTTRLDSFQTQINALATVPSGTIAFFASSSCPSGWTSYTDADGRYIVAVTDGTDSVGSSGTLGTAFGNRGDHSHSHSTPSHRHEWAQYDATDREYWAWDSTGTTLEMIDWDDGMDTTGSGQYPMADGGSTSRSFYTATDGSGTTGTVNRSAIAPYIQLRACQKT